MSTQSLDYGADVPANASRFFASREEALAQPPARIDLVWDTDDPFVRNASFDPSVIRYDDCYCTSVVDLDRQVQVPTLQYFDEKIALHLPPDGTVAEIGCGQGEFVERLRAKGYRAVGYDPVLRKESEHLHRKFWSRSEPPADLYVMRCVLPHIDRPWDFLADMAEASDGALVLIEFQRLEWIVEHEVWYQVSHDHVNLFSVLDFSSRYSVVDTGTFSNGEWAWVLVDLSTAPRRSLSRPAVDPAGIQALAAREAALRTSISALGRPVVVWGAAGKGTVLAHMLVGCRVEVSAIDADPVRWGLYLERSGVRIASPDDHLAALPVDAMILVCNPNHLDAVRGRVPAEWPVLLPADVR